MVTVVFLFFSYYGVMYFNVKNIIDDFKSALYEEVKPSELKFDLLEDFMSCGGKKNIKKLKINSLYTIHNFKSGKIIIGYDKECVDGSGGLNYKVKVSIKRSNGEWEIEDYSYLTV